MYMVWLPHQKLQFHENLGNMYHFIFSIWLTAFLIYSKVISVIICNSCFSMWKCLGYAAVSLLLIFSPWFVWGLIVYGSTFCHYASLFTSEILSRLDPRLVDLGTKTVFDCR